MQLTIFTDYGLRSLMYVAARPGQQCSVKEIAEHYAISRNHLVKVVHRLAQLGYIKSTKGKGGGIMLALPAAHLRLGQLVQQLETNMNLVECFDPQTSTCRMTGRCSLEHILTQANAAFLASLDQYTLADITQQDTSTAIIQWLVPPKPDTSRSNNIKQ